MTTPTKKAKGLTDTSVKSAKPKDKEYKLSDGGGLNRTEFIGDRLFKLGSLT